MGVRGSGLAVSEPTKALEVDRKSRINREEPVPQEGAIALLLVELPEDAQQVRQAGPGPDRPSCIERLGRGQFCGVLPQRGDATPGASAVEAEGASTERPYRKGLGAVAGVSGDGRGREDHDLDRFAVRVIAGRPLEALEVDDSGPRSGLEGYIV